MPYVGPLDQCFVQWCTELHSAALTWTVLVNCVLTDLVRAHFQRPSALCFVTDLTELAL